MTNYVGRSDGLRPPKELSPPLPGLGYLGSTAMPRPRRSSDGKASKDLTLIDLFAGCGGMTVGFQREGFVPVKAVEWDAHAAATYAANFGEEHVFCGDIADLLSTDVPKVDVIIGGPPCQGFSNLGGRNPTDPRNKLWRDYLRIVQVAHPQVFVIENVDRFRSSPEFQLLMHEFDRGALQEYEVVHGVLCAADYGVPQRRHRTILIASRVGTPTLPPPTHSREARLGLLPWTTVRSAIGDLPSVPDTTDLPHTTVSMFGLKIPGIFKSTDLHIGRNPRETSKLRYDCIPPGGGRFDLPDDLMPNCWRNKPTGTTDVMGRMRWDQPSLTIRTEFFKPEKGQYLHPQWDPGDARNRVNRPITHQEAARLQTFPRDYLWCGAKIAIAKQIGNAVPTLFAQAIAQQVRALLPISTSRLRRPGI